MAVDQRQGLDPAFVADWNARYRTHYDSIDMARQMGVLPPVGGRAERLLGALQPLQARVQRRRAGLG